MEGGMRGPSKRIVTIGIILLGGLTVAGLKWYKERNAQAISGPLVRTKGNRNAPIHVIEFIDFQCPACAAGSAFLKDFMDKHPGLVRLELKYFPLEKIHHHSLISIRYAECAGRQGRFWPFHDLLLTKQSQWANLAEATSVFDLMAREVGVDPGRLKSCLADEALDALINSDKEEGKSRGVNSTPTYFVNGQLVVGGKSLEVKLNQSMSELKADTAVP